MKQELPGNVVHMVGGKREDVAMRCFPLGESIEAGLITGNLVLHENPLKPKIARVHGIHRVCRLHLSFFLFYFSI